jgi:hypothetical protein
MSAQVVCVPAHVPHWVDASEWLAGGGSRGSAQTLEQPWGQAAAAQQRAEERKQ